MVNLLNFLNGEHLLALAKQSGFIKRTPRKLDLNRFLVTLFLSVLHGSTALSWLAIKMGQLQERTISKQAICKRMNTQLECFLELVLAHTLKTRLEIFRPVGLSRLPFKRILVHDSTTLALPARLAAHYPGSKNRLQKDSASVKIQTVYDLLQETFVWFYFTPFTVNDQHIASTTSTQFVRSGDLLIRDLGYFVFSAMEELQSLGAFFLTRLRYGTVLFDPHTGERINLLNVLQNGQQCDRQVLVGAEKQLRARLVAVPVPPNIAQERRRRLRANRDLRANPSKEHLATMGWSIFLLNVDDEILPPDEVVALYGLRWRIEIIFKAWKSHFHKIKFSAFNSARQVRVTLYALCIFVTLFHCLIVAPLNSITGTNALERPMSLIKLARYFKELFIAAVFFLFPPHNLWQQLRYHAQYERRADRLNYVQKKALLS